MDILSFFKRKSVVTYLDDVTWSEAYRHAIGGSCKDPIQLCALLRSSWDIWESAQPNEPMGLARLPHLAILRDIDPIAHKLQPVLAADMDVSALEAGFWRQLRIYPNAATDPEQADDPFAPDAEVPVDEGRGRFLRRIFGHDVADCVRYLDDVRSRDPILFRLLLAKDYGGAFRHHPDILSDPWPDEAKARWLRTKGRDHLPPVLALALITEASRLGHNQHGLINLSLDTQGRELFIRPYLDAIPTIAGPIAPPPWLARQVENALFQTTALLPPDYIFPHEKDGILIMGDPVLGRAWSEGAATAIAAAIAAGGSQLVGNVTRPATVAQARAMQGGIAFHPRHQPEHHAGKPPSIQKGQPAAYWGMNWHIHPVVGLLDLARQAFDWSARYRTGKDCLRNWSGGTPKRWLTQAIAAISYCWAESYSPAALATALAPILAAKRAWRRANADARSIEGAIELTDEECEIDALADGSNFGSTLCAKGLKQLASLPGPGEEGYTARYRAHLWFDARGDDIAHYRSYYRKAMKRKRNLQRTGAAIDPAMLGQLDPAHARLLTMPHGRRQAAIAPSGGSSIAGTRRAILSAQDVAMTLSPFALDPMRLVNAEPHRWSGATHAPHPTIDATGG